ncbi:MAG: hydrogenase maturation protease [Bryobacteraceae bacterium]
MMPETSPILVLGLGNLLLRDDGVGLRLLEDLASETPNDDVEFVDGGTQGLALLPYLSDRAAVIVLDAIGLGAEPGTVHVLRGEAIGKLRARRAESAHEGNGLTLLETARLLGEELHYLAVIGVEPAEVRTGVGLSSVVAASVPQALDEARSMLREMKQLPRAALAV